MSEKSGYLRYKCVVCGALVKQEVSDVEVSLMNSLRSPARYGTHQCTETHLGVTELIGATLDEERTPE